MNELDFGRFIRDFCGLTPPVDPSIVASIFGVNFYLFNYKTHLAGLYISEDNDTYSIGVNASLIPEERNIVIAHELGHHFLSQRSSQLFMESRNILNLPANSDLEMRCWKFAAGLLLDSPLENKHYKVPKTFLAFSKFLNEK